MRTWSFIQRCLTVSKVLLAAQPLLVVADEALQRSVLVLAGFAKVAPQARQRLVERIVLPQVGVGAVVPRARINVGVVVAVGADDQRTGATWRGKSKFNVAAITANYLHIFFFNGIRKSLRCIFSSCNLSILLLIYLPPPTSVCLLWLYL